MHTCSSSWFPDVGVRLATHLLYCCLHPSHRSLLLAFSLPLYSSSAFLESLFRHSSHLKSGLRRFLQAPCSVIIVFFCNLKHGNTIIKSCIGEVIRQPNVIGMNNANSAIHRALHASTSKHTAFDHLRSRGLASTTCDPVRVHHDSRCCDFIPHDGLSQGQMPSVNLSVIPLTHIR